MVQIELMLLCVHCPSGYKIVKCDLKGIIIYSLVLWFRSVFLIDEKLLCTLHYVNVLSGKIFGAEDLL